MTGVHLGTESILQITLNINHVIYVCLVMATKVLTWSTGPGKWILLVSMILSLGGFHTEQHVEFYFWCQSTLTLHQEQAGLL